MFSTFRSCEPTALVPGAWKDLLNRLPEDGPPSPTARSGAISSPRRLTSTRSSRQLCVLSRTPVWKPTSPSCPRVSRRSVPACIRQRFPSAPAGKPRPPNIDIAPRREIALLPCLVSPATPPSTRNHPATGSAVLAQESGEGLLEVAGGNATQVQDRKQSIEALRPPRPFRQDRRREPNLLRRAHLAAVADLRPPDGDRPDPGLDRALRPMAVTPTRSRHPQLHILPHRDEGVGFGDQHLTKHRRAPSRASSLRGSSTAQADATMTWYLSTWRIAPSWRFWQAPTCLDRPSLKPSSPRCR